MEPPRVDPTAELVVVDRGRRLAFSFADLMRYHGPGSPGGVAHAFKVMERALAMLDPAGPVERWPARSAAARSSASSSASRIASAP
jgi:hypothetical protein